MKLIGVIPARYQSTRLPGKPLADICGKPMIWWVYQQVKRVKQFDEIFVATDDERMLMYGKEASNRKQEIDRQHHTIPNKRTKDKHYGNVHNRLWNHG